MDNLLDEMKDFREEYGDTYINKSKLKKLEYRREEQEADLVRGEFQRDRDRIIHSRAFRRLSGKTQVFNSNKGDHYRTRLTHSLEVSQIGRTIGRLLGLDEDLIEAIALGHDLGHTPFGHVIERTLHDILKNNEIEELEIDIPGGFKHNYQSLHLVDNIEMGHRQKRGLNLTLAVRDGILKHTGSKMKSSKTDRKEEVHYDSINLGLNGVNLMDYDHAITLEGQVVALADEIAQSTHDLEDGVRSKIISLENLSEDFKIELARIKNNFKDDSWDSRQFEKLDNQFEELLESLEKNGRESTLVTNKLINYLIDFFVRDAIENSSKNIGKKAKGSNTIFNKQGLVDEVLIDNSIYVKEFRKYVSKYIFKNVVSSQEIAQSDSKSKYLIKQIFKAYYEDPRQLPDYALYRYFSPRGKSLERTIIVEKKSELQKDPEFIRVICDHIAGMTDSFAMDEYNNLYGVTYTL